MSRLILALFLVYAITSTASGADATTGRQCTKKEAMAADKEAAYLNTWNEIYGSYRKYRHCDDGAIATGYTDSVVRALTQHWNGLSELARITRKDSRFEAFVLRHISPTALTEDLQRIMANECPDGVVELCKKVQRAAERALSSS